MLTSFSAAHFGAAAPVQWIEVAPGSGFTAGKPSTTSFVSFVADRPLAQDRRVDLLERLSASWAERADCTLDEVLAVFADPA